VWVRAGVMALLALAFLQLAVSTVRRGKGDIFGYFVIGQAVLHGESPYLDIDEAKKHWAAGNVWSPAFSLAVVPIAALALCSETLAMGVWQAGNLLALAWMLSLVARLVLRRSLSWDPRGDGLLPCSLALLVPIGLAYEGITGNFLYVQVNLMLFALVLQGLLWQARGRPVLGGVAIGTAAALKLMPVLFLPYLVWRRRWRAAAWTLIAFVGVSLSPVLVSGWAGFVRDVHEWRHAMGAGWGSGMMNQSMPATWDRYLGYGVVPFGTPPSNVLAVSGSLAVAVAVWATRLLTMGLALWTFRGPMEPDGRSALAEWSVVFLVGAVYGPITHKAYLVVLVLPYALLLALAADRRGPRGLRRGAAALLVVALLLSVVPSRDFVGRDVAAYFHMAGSYALSAMAVLFGLFWVRRWPTLDEASPHPGASLTRTGAP